MIKDFFWLICGFIWSAFSILTGSIPLPNLRHQYDDPTRFILIEDTEYFYVLALAPFAFMAWGFISRALKMNN